MKAALEVAEIGVAKMREELKPGMTEDELWSILHKTNIEYGGEWIECRILSSGERTNPWMQESSNKIMQTGEMVAFDTDMVGPYGYCADISRSYVVGHKFNDEQKNLYSMATDQIDHNARLIKPGMSFKEFVKNLGYYLKIIMEIDIHAWFMELDFVMSGLRLSIQQMVVSRVEVLKKI